MSPEFDPIPGAAGYQHSNPPVLSSIPLIAHLDILKRAGGIDVLREKSFKLTGYLWDLLTASPFYVAPAASEDAKKSSQIGFRILTPSDPAARGCQLSLMILPQGSHLMEKVFGKMVQAGVIGDERRPDVIRLSPVPLYNRYADVSRAVQVLEDSLRAVVDERDKAA
jgi:kynureninase